MANGDGNNPTITPEQLAEELENRKKQKDAIAQVSSELSQYKEEVRQLNALEAAAREARAAGLPVSEEAAKKIEELKKSTEAYTNALERNADVEKLRQDALRAGEEALGALVGKQNLAALSLSGMTSELFKQVGAFDDAATTLGKTSGYTTALNKDMREAASGANGLSVSMAEAGAALGTLSTDMSLFATLSGDARREITDTVLALELLGVSAEVSAAALDTMTRGMGMSAGAAENTIKSFDALAQSVGLPVSQIAEGFASISGDLARYGVEGPKVFKKLQKEARSLGISVKEAFDLAEAFDTFESAANLAGKLNAQIGLQLNSVELMNASHEDRIKILRSEFKMRGKNFNDMSRRQKQAIAEVMGVDVDMASRIFGDPVALRKYQKEQKELAERAQAVTTVTKDLQEIFEDLMLTLGPVVEYIRDFMKFVSKSGTAKIILAAAALYKFAGGMKSIKAMLSSVAGKGGDKINQMSEGIKSSGKSAAGSLKSMLGFAAVIVAIGAGIFLAATGVGNLVSSFKDLGEAAWPAVAGIVAFGVATALIIFVLAKMAPAALPAIAVLGGIALAAFATGLAMNLIAEAIATIAEAAAGLGGALLSPMEGVAKGLTSMFRELASIGALKMGILAVAVGGLSAALAGLMLSARLDKIQGVEGLLNALNAAGASIETIKASAESLNALEKVLTISSEIDEAKLKSVTALAAGPASGAAATPKPKAYTIPITFQLKNSKVEQYVIDIVDDKFDLTRID